MVNNTNNPIEVRYFRSEDGTRFPVCPVCGEIAFEFDRCLYCGQRFDMESFQDDVVTVKISPEGKLYVQET